MPDRLADLRRQRALVQDHLAWLDREIAEAAAATNVSPPAPPRSAVDDLVERSPAPRARISAVAMPEAANAIPVEALIEDYRVSPVSLKSDLRKGCLIYLACGLALLGVAVAALYFWFRHGK
jgi:hypothetical protein